MTEQVVLANGVVVRMQVHEDAVTTAPARRAAGQQWHWEDALVNAIARTLHRLAHPIRNHRRA